MDKIEKANDLIFTGLTMIGFGLFLIYRIELGVGLMIGTQFGWRFRMLTAREADRKEEGK